MQTWRTRMPKGMRLKSEGFASTLYDPRGEYRLSHYCRDHALPYADIGLPVDLDVFARYGLAFQKKYVPTLEDRQVVGVAADGKARGGAKHGFTVTLDDGQEARFRQVICAVGITHYAHVAAELTDLPGELLSHSSIHPDLARFAGKTVLVVGGGASAADCAALLSEAGADTHIVTRHASLRFHAPPRPRSRMDRVRRPFSTIGPGWRSVMCTQAPLVFHSMPEGFRLDVTRRHLGPAPCWFVRDSIERGVKVHTRVSVVNAREKAGRAVLELAGAEGGRTLEGDHVIAATGYRVDLGRLGFLPPALREDIRMVQRTPVLSRSFEASVPGMYFVGASSANAFGPLVRFACGAEFTARRLVRRIV